MLSTCSNLPLYTSVIRWEKVNSYLRFFLLFWSGRYSISRKSHEMTTTMLSFLRWPISVHMKHIFKISLKQEQDVYPMNISVLQNYKKIAKDMFLVISRWLISFKYLYGAERLNDYRLRSIHILQKINREYCNPCHAV